MACLKSLRHLEDYVWGAPLSFLPHAHAVFKRSPRPR